MSEEALEEVLRKASSDAQFRSRLQTDLEGAVRGFDLSAQEKQQLRSGDRKSTRLNSSHSQISYAVFCLKKNKTQHTSPDWPTNSGSLPLPSPTDIAHTHHPPYSSFTCGFLSLSRRSSYHIAAPLASRVP